MQNKQLKYTFQKYLHHERQKKIKNFSKFKDTKATWKLKAMHDPQLDPGLEKMAITDITEQLANF